MIDIFRLPSAFAYIGSVIATADVNTYLAVGMAAVALVFGPRALKIRDLKARNEALNVAIEEGRRIGQVHEERKVQLEDELRGAQERANIAEARAADLIEQVAGWRSRYDEKAAGTTLDEVKALLSDVIAAGDRRHAETIDLFRRLAGEKSVTDPGGFS